ncbi:hypothetical protein RM545_11560 [Zunongwangia sp. F260]|uniref:Uncharacterized protein n=1 Tax=Autumnicola lenta TaxID=3075593 RepID=A0ABU3CLV1_9FLAO|nr:hypothetical protein [Zunongwangia sp. F260]MDT0647327.1 hypothetical protein [Zunongwangia sp. F260]
MRKKIFCCLSFLLMVLWVNGQSKYETGMDKAFEFWGDEQISEAANVFERIAIAEENNWVPYYYASQIKIVESFEMTDAVKKEQQLEQAQELLDKAGQYAGEDNVEVMVLQGLLHTAYITMEPSVYGMKLSPVISNIYEDAAKIAPRNPRVILSKAEWNMGAAKFFGRDPKEYCKDLKKSLELFSDFEPEEKYAPEWGESRARQLIVETCGKI